MNRHPTRPSDPSALSAPRADTKDASSSVAAARQLAWAFLSASGLDRAEHCPWAYALSNARPAEDTAASSAASRGTAIHLYLERIQQGWTREAALAECTDDVYAVCTAIPLDALPRGLAEVAFAYNVQTRTVRVLERSEHRDYGTLDPYEIPGTADLLVGPHENNGIPLVIDWKTGYDTVSPAQGNLQLAFHACCLRSLSGCEAVEVAIYRIDGDGQLHPDLHTLDSLDLEAAHQRIAHIFEIVRQTRTQRAESATPETHEGKHCKYCPARPNCPVYAREAAAIERVGDSWLSTINAQIQSDQDAAYWFDRIQKAEHVVEEVKKLLRARLAQKAMILPDGRIVRLAKEQRKKIDGKRALEVLQTQLPPDVVQAMCHVTITQSSVRAACGEMAEAVLTLLDQAGAVVRYEQATLRTSKS